MLAVQPVEKDLEEEERPKSLTAWAHAQADSTREEQDLWSTKGACVRNMIDGKVPTYDDFGSTCAWEWAP